ncbi:hypothetical protein GGI07_003852 [Coemansia sp. Benny D115]|nr:hypothetical protein GGI07_003852 [Coemansia sp. Benny D115]
MSTIIHANGASVNENTPGAKAAYGVYYGARDPLNEAHKLENTGQPPTKTLAALEAVRCALQKMQETGEGKRWATLYVKTNSEEAIDLINQDPEDVVGEYGEVVADIRNLSESCGCAVRIMYSSVGSNDVGSQEAYEMANEMIG